MLKLNLAFKAETKSCYRFEGGKREDNSLITLYPKKTDVDSASIDPRRGHLRNSGGGK